MPAEVTATPPFSWGDEALWTFIPLGWLCHVEGVSRQGLQWDTNTHPRCWTVMGKAMSSWDD